MTQPAHRRSRVDQYGRARAAAALPSLEFALSVDELYRDGLLGS
jgi:hypothetical protein